jgi:TRAP-type C4-dicarboxylate transport system permease small subunit
MRRLLDGLYRASGAAAAAFLVAICAVVLLQVGCNTIDWLVKLAGGTPIGLVIPSYAEFAGFFLCASSFLALASSLRAGAHIRVMVALERLPAGARRAAELWCAAAATAVSGYFAWYTIELVADSLEYNDLSPGIVPVPLWIPQAAMAAGLVILTVAFADELARLVRGGEPGYASAAPGAAEHE